MTLDQQTKHFETLVEKMRQTMLRKGNDYSTQDDRLSNFKQAGAITNTHPAKVALIVAAIKISRMCALIDSGKKPENEAMEDTSLDLCCYAILNDAVLNEHKVSNGKFATDGHATSNKSH